MREIEQAGFFRIDLVERYQPNYFHVIDHQQWAKAHPNCCTEKLSMPWEGEGDPLGPRLHAISGQRVKFFPGQMKGLRSRGFSDEQIIKHFRDFLAAPPERWEEVYTAFYRHLTEIASESSRCRRTSVSTDSRTSVSTAAGHGSPTSSRFESRIESSIPASAVLMISTSKNLGAKPPSEEEWESRKRMLKRQAEELMS
jgi:hypothetical protein